MKRNTMLRGTVLAAIAGAILSLAGVTPARAWYDNHAQWHDWGERPTVGFGVSVGAPIYGYYPAYPAYSYPAYSYGYEYPYSYGASVGFDYGRR